MSGRAQRTRPGFAAIMLTVLVMLAMLAAVGCNAEADVVAAPLVLDAASSDAAPGDGDGSANDECSLAMRFQRAHLPEVALDLILDCEVRFSAIRSPTSSMDRDISPEEFSQLVTAPQLESDAGLIGEALCNGSMTAGWYALPLDKPERAILCPKTCERFRQQIASLLAQDGCDGPVDAGPQPSFGGFPGGSGPGGPGSGGTRDDDAGFP